MIKIIGLGPGHHSYVLPIAIEAIKSADLVIGAKRHLESIIEFSTKTMDYAKGFDEIKKVLVHHRPEEIIAIVVSGDVGFYSLLDFVKRNVEDQLIEVIPGISSLQYLYSKLGYGYEQSIWISFHGRTCNLDDHIRSETELGVLLDNEQNNQYIASQFKKVRANLVIKDKKVGGAPVFYVGEKLSYEDEKITRLTIDGCINYKAEDLSVVIVRYE